ncbi:hypothetical protein L916_19878, partial [Phytophthora nicotianae]
MKSVVLPINHSNAHWTIIIVVVDRHEIGKQLSRAFVQGRKKEWELMRILVVLEVGRCSGLFYLFTLYLKLPTGSWSRIVMPCALGRMRK